MIKINNLINEFIVKIKNIDFELYNESGLQHELGYYLRCNNIQTKFEYSTNIIFINTQEFLKKDLDLYIKDKHISIID
jgi:hypothetical protein